MAYTYGLAERPAALVSFLLELNWLLQLVSAFGLKTVCTAFEWLEPPQ